MLNSSHSFENTPVLRKLVLTNTVRKYIDTYFVNKGNNKITELRTILQTDKISQQPENCENRNDPDLVQAFLKKWWVESVN